MKCDGKLVSSTVRLVLKALDSFASPCRPGDSIQSAGQNRIFRWLFLFASVCAGRTGWASWPRRPVSSELRDSAGSPSTRNLSGWEFSGQYKLLPFLGAVADFSGNYGALDGAGTRVHAFLFGPQVSLPRKVSPFAHVLIGTARESQDSFVSGGFFSLGSDKSLAVAVGAGIDVKAIPCLRPTNPG